MGIPRLTGDMIQYLEPAIITNGVNENDAVAIRNLIIDGPSLVHHVYDRVARHNNAMISHITSHTMPTYQQLTKAVYTMLEDLESCGAIIEHIFFDGALPLWKRNIRLDRLEKTRLQLEQFKLQRSCPLSSGAAQSLTSIAASDALWQANAGRERSSPLIAPFVVPAVIDCLKTSKWSKRTTTVPDEADSFCAAAAIRNKAAVLTNDSDFLLLVDARESLPILLLNSLSRSPSRSSIHAKCWRPNHIMAKLGVEDLRTIAFVRSKDSTVSFATVIQRALDAKNSSSTPGGFTQFLQQLASNAASQPAIYSTTLPKLLALDPRLSELVCQLSTSGEASTGIEDQEVWMTLPTLFEDPDRDASWAYGRALRELAYSLLVVASGRSDSVRTIREFSRKGQRVTSDTHHMTSGAELRDKIQKATFDLSYLASEPLSTPDSASSTDYLRWALESVLRQRSNAGKQKLSPVTIHQLFGSAGLPVWSAGINTSKDSQTHDNIWRIIHLNSNIQAVLYSLRLLAQVCASVIHEAACLEFEATLAQLSGLLTSMPIIPDLFLDVFGVRSLMQSVPNSRINQILDKILGTYGYDVPVQPVSDMKPSHNETSRKRRKKKHMRTTVDKSGGGDMSNAGARLSTNPFELLARNI